MNERAFGVVLLQKNPIEISGMRAHFRGYSARRAVGEDAGAGRKADDTSGYIRGRVFVVLHAGGDSAGILISAP
jgi:hypothetical protein